MHVTANELITTIIIIVSIGINQVQSVTSVGGGEFSSPVTVSLREQPSDNTEQSSAPASSSNSNQAGLIAGVTVSVIVLLLGVTMAAIAIIFW